MNAKPATILIVEDSPVQAELLRRALEGAGYRVLAARDGAEGLAMAKESHPVAVVSDINMPVMDGYALCHAIRHDDGLKTTPVILLTMLSDPQDVIHGLNAGADAYVTKPYNVPALVSRIQLLLAHPPAPAPAIERRKLEIELGGETHLVEAHGPRMLNLLISTYENAVLQNRELIAVQQALEDLNQHLEQKVLEKTAALRQSEMELKEAQRVAQLGNWILDSATNQVVWSEELYRMLGLDPTQPAPPYTEHHRLFTPESWKQLSTALPRTQETGIPYELELEMVRRDGSKGWMLARGEPRRDATGSIVGLRGVAQDITERKRAEAAIVTSETKFRRLFEAARDGILILDVQNGQILDVNPFMIELLGYTREQYLGKKLWEIGPFKDTAAARSAFAALQDKKYAHYEDLPLRTADGRDINAEFVSHVYRVNSGEVVQCNIRDITERKRAEEKLARLNRLYATLSGINMTIVHAASPAELFDRVCEVAVTHGRFSVAWIGTVDRADQTVTPVAQRGLSQDDMAMIRDSIGSIAEGKGRTATAISERRMIYINDYETERATSPWQAEAAKRGIHGSATLPIEQGGEIVGVLKLYVRERDFFDPGQLALLEEMRADISFALDRFDNEAKRTQAEAALQESEVRLKAIFDAAADGILLAEIETRRFRAANVSICRMLGYSQEEMLDLDISGIHPEEALPDVIRQFELQVNGKIGVATDLPVKRKDGSVFFADVNSTPVTLGGKACLLGIFRDVTDRKLAAQERERQEKRLARGLEQTVVAMATTVEMRDPYTAGHQRRVAELAVAIARELGVPDEQVHGLHLAGIIHDLGKIHIPAEILSKPGKLTDIEFSLIKIHPQAGYDILKDVEFPWPIAQIVLQHHERLDGSGYPNGLKGDAIILEARILAVADVVEAMSSHRPYRPGLGIEKALSEIGRGRGSAYEPAVVDACVRLFREKQFSWV